MPRIALFAAIAFCFLIALAFTPAPPLLPASAQQQDKAPGAVVFQNPYGNVAFDHNGHRQYGCSQCHPPFDFKHDAGAGYSLRAHGLCITCHEKSSVSTRCGACHSVHQRAEKPFDPAVMESGSPERQRALDFFFNRRSIRKFQDRAVADDVIRDLLKAAMAAPSAGSWQPWEFIVVKEKAVKTALAGTSPFAKFVRDAPVIIAVAGRTDNHWAPFDCALAGGNILLAAANFGLGGTYCGYDREREAKAREVLGVPDGYRIYSLIPLGYPAESKKAHTKYNEDRVHWNRFQPGRPESVVGEKGK